MIAQARKVFENPHYSVTFLGGYREVGRVCAVITNLRTGKILVVDAGAFFTDDNLFGEDDGIADLFQEHNSQYGSHFLPRFQYLRGKQEEIVGVFVSHGHADHIAGLPYLYELIGENVPLITSRFAWLMIENVFAQLERRLNRRFTRPRTIRFINEETKSLEIPDMGTLFPIPVNHSIRQAYGFGLRLARGGQDGLVYFGDFKIEGENRLKKKMSRRLTKIFSEMEVSCLVTEALYCDRPGRTPAETTVNEPFRQVLRDYPDRTVNATFFASNLDRLESLVGIGLEEDRRYDFCGSAMTNSVVMGREIAARLPKSPSEDDPEYPVNLRFITGSQGEPGSQTSRRASGRGEPRFSKDEILVVMSEPIPGNERQFCEMLIASHYWLYRIIVTPRTYDLLMEYAGKNNPSVLGDWLINGEGEFFPGLKNVVEARENIHTSGHLSADELKEMITRFRDHHSQITVVGYHFPASKAPAWEALLRDC